ncbi:class I SAM-dependent methyltransferase [Nocardioides sp. GCM10027113]|uniref:class I SAM-dependent methyltransferase n=1 Tax=unclassified Nocardioides TaxID=2615069 RepID=UPI00361B616F
MRHYVRVRSVTDDGLVLHTVGDRPLDVCLDGRRVWTFWTRRDTEPVLGQVLGRAVAAPRRVAWPAPLQRHLHGSARVEVRDPVTGQVFYDRELTLGEGGGRIEVRNAQGVELGIDKSGKLVPTFAGRSEADIEALLDATEAVIEALRSTGLDPFLAYGTLLGAVREGAVLGHDSDADLGYVSGHTHPVDVARESFAVQRILNAQGWETSRYSGGAFKVSVVRGGSTIGLDVFGGFLDHGRLYLMGEIGTEFEPDWIHPLTTAELSGRPMPVPARPEKLLEATYGPGWRVPDPAFKFTTPERTVRALEDWFRGTQPGLRHWERQARPLADPDFREPSFVARRAAELAQQLDAEVLDVGAGRGADSLWLAGQGLKVTAYDYVPRALEPARRRAAAQDLDLEVRSLNLTELRSVLAEGTRLAHSPRPRVVLARHLLDATSSVGRESFARLCSMALRGGGRVLADFHVGDPDGTATVEPPEWMVGEVDVDAMTTLLRGAGASRVDVRELPKRNRPTVRLVGEWTCS